MPDLGKTEPEVTIKTAIEHGLTEEEYKKIVTILGRTPSFTELGIYSVMWSEHCSYKNSISMLKTLPRSGGRLLVSAGEENAGLVDIGDGLAVAFKIESHNHPSAVEPYQGAATGVGGIMRDIFTMGARPIASLNSLRFGDLSDPQSRRYLRGVVKGIGDYGNSFGVPTVAGEIYFDKSYQGNPIVNAMAVGIVRHEEVASAIAKGEGSSVMIVGSSTGRDGIHGATFASEEISEESEKKRPSVQVGDPFTEKLLLEATLEVIKAGYIVGIQDMGAAGITCSTTEMSAKGNSGMLIDLDKVPVRESGMSAYEIMLSESQERMLLVAKKGCEEGIAGIFRKWDLQCVIIGTVSDYGFVRVLKEGKVVALVPAESLALGGGAPVYTREAKEPSYIKNQDKIDFNSLPLPSDYNEVILRLIKSPNIASKRWVHEQYDSMVRTNTVVLPGSDAAVIQIKGTSKYLAMKTDCNARYVYLNPRKGSEIAVAESARNIVCSGGRPIGITNCLNFGNPYKPESYWQFKESVEGIGSACRALGTPVTGGNVSFYNESPNGPIYPTPVIGMVGLIEESEYIMTSSYKSSGDIIILLGESRGDINASEYLTLIHGITGDDAPHFDIHEEIHVQECCAELLENQLLHSAHDISDGGLAVALIESTIQSSDKSLGCEIKPLETIGVRTDSYLFGEEQGRIIVSCAPEDVEAIKKISASHQVSCSIIGRVTENSEITIGASIQLERELLSNAYFGALEELMQQ